MLRAAWWTWRALRAGERQLEVDGTRVPRLPTPPRVPASAGRGVAAVLRRREATCLVRTVVRQEWHNAHGSPRDLVVGVLAPDENFQAHAWLEGDQVSEEYREIWRRPAAR